MHLECIFAILKIYDLHNPGNLQIFAN